MPQQEPRPAPRALAITFVTSDGSMTYEVDRSVPESARERALLRALLELSLKNLDTAENPALQVWSSGMQAVPCEMAR